jgi:hypothetical protein
MTNIEAAKEKVELAQKHIDDQRQRIVRYKELVAQLERDDKHDFLPLARELLRNQEHILAGMVVEQASMRNKLTEATDENGQSARSRIKQRLRKSL